MGDKHEVGERYALLSYLLHLEHYYHRSRPDGRYSFRRSSHSIRQPQVPPPPSLTSMHNNKSTHRGENERLEPSCLIDGMQHHSTGRREPTIQADCDTGYQGSVEVNPSLPPQYSNNNNSNDLPAPMEQSVATSRPADTDQDFIRLLPPD